jgi:hypothetical protein
LAFSSDFLKEIGELAFGFAASNFWSFTGVCSSGKLKQIWLSSEASRLQLPSGSNSPQFDFGVCRSFFELLFSQIHSFSATETGAIDSSQFCLGELRPFICTLTAAKSDTSDRLFWADLDLSF